MIYASLSLRASCIIFPSNIRKPSGFDCKFVKFYDTELKLCHMLCMYVPPNLSRDTFLSIEQYICECLDFLLETNPETSLFVCGDCNRYNFEFLTCYFNLVNIVQVPTFGNATLDKFFCDSSLHAKLFVNANPPLGNAVNAHNVVMIHRNLTSEGGNVKVHLHKVYDLRESHMSIFRDVLSKADWSFLHHCDSVDKCVEYFYHMFYKALSSVPVSFVKFTPKTKPWITPVVIELINKRWLAYKQKNFSLYVHYKKKVQEEILKCKRIWSKKMCSSSKGIWSVVNDVRGKNSSNSVDSIVALFTDPVSAAESINRAFCETFVKSDFFPELTVDIPVSNICHERDVLCCLKALKTDKSAGSDCIIPVLLKEAADVLVVPLCYIFNLSFKSGEFPSAWKIADICPVPKSKPVSKDQLRPISLLPCVSKIFEKVIFRKYSCHFIECYDKQQFAYRPESSTVCALLAIQDKVLKLLDDPSVGAVRLIAFDMSKAFDRVPHHQLLLYFSELSLPNRPSFVNWLSSYLSNRQQRVKL